MSRLKINVEKRSVTLNEQELQLTNAEFDILTFFMNHPDRALSKKEINESIWKGNYWANCAWNCSHWVCATGVCSYFLVKKRIRLLHFSVIT